MSDLDIVLRITARREEAPDAVSLCFARPPGLTFRPGDWMDIRFPAPEFPFGRTYSFASSPTEPDLRITFKRGVSPFKRRLECAETGETLLITQYGSNGFLLDRRFPAVFIAGGVGITPFRSILKELVDTDADVPVTLIYQNRTADFPFKGELDDWARRCPWLTLRYRASATDGRFSQATLRQLLPDLAARQPLAYVAGPPGMVARAATFLHGLGLSEDDIKTDSFTGYRPQGGYRCCRPTNTSRTTGVMRSTGASRASSTRRYCWDGSPRSWSGGRTTRRMMADRPARHDSSSQNPTIPCNGTAAGTSPLMRRWRSRGVLSRRGRRG